MKDKKININVGYEKLSKEEIDSHKDFKKVYESYLATKIKPMKVAKKFTFTKMIVATAAVTVITVTIWKYTAVRHTAVKATSSAAVKHSPVIAKQGVAVKKAFINPPIKGVDVPYKSYTIDAAKGGTLTYNKSKITIPAHALCDEKGNEVKGDVTINYREFHDAIDFFVSGIPMTYDSAGVKYNFESAGMLDIKGIQNGKSVYVKQGKNIQVAMSSFQMETKYNVYRLDTVKKNWTYISKSKYVVQPTKAVSIPKQQTQDTVTAQSIAQNDLATANRQLKKLETGKPVKANEDRYTLTIDADTSDFPELSNYKNVIFEVDPNTSYKLEWANALWTDAKLSSKNNGKDYIFSVSNSQEKHDILVHPVFKGKDYDLALKDYTQKYNEYVAKVAEKQEALRKQQEEYEKRMAEMKKEEDEAALKAKTETQVTNYLSLDNFGIVNCDCPQNLPTGAELTVNYTDDRKDNLNNSTVFLVQKDKNSIIRYWPGHNCSFDPTTRNFAWVITPDNKLAVYSEDDFKKITQTSGNYTFVMKTLNDNIQSYEDVKEALKFYL